MKSIVDLRSDTVTRPTAAMRRVIAEAEVGDDVLGDDPTVIRLQERCAELLGKPAAVYVPSGSMANLVSIRAVCEPGDEIICDNTTHSYNYETAGPAALAGASMRLIHSPRGVFTPADVTACLRPPGEHFPNSRMVIIENTNNRGGGTVWTTAEVEAIRNVSESCELHLHLDGARLMNACVAVGCRPTDYTRHVDSVSLCFSKGLGAPVGSIVAGPMAFISRARRFRKQFGGAMRQSGLLAAAAIYALDHHVDRLAEDHRNAARLARGLAEIAGLRVNPAAVQTNIVMIELEERLGPADAFSARLREAGVWLMATGPRTLRAVTHLDVSTDQIDAALRIFTTSCRSEASTLTQAATS
ncbi:MAG: aminotransferase class I/II-fold pyridoxal phosphate-dependent enzyme [Planctomycetia bacterium]|nr:MAG: aminotransferase class I/II-fold pyridoxal phosphate-dependent enzyme [Planctomycetia bacterium]